MSGFDDLDTMIAAVRRLGAMPAEAAKVAAPLVEEALRATVRAGTDPDGHPWAPRKVGGQALVHAADHLSTKAVGTIVRTTLRGVDVYHHFGAGVPRRQILPDPGTIPRGVGAALERAAAQVFAAVVGR